MPDKKPAAEKSPQLGSLWSIPAASSQTVTITAPDQSTYTVDTTPDGHGERHAQIVLDRPGSWSAVVSNGDEHTAVVQ